MSESKAQPDAAEGNENASPAPRRTSMWILNSWQDLALFIATPLLILPLIPVAMRGNLFTPVELGMFVAAFGAMGHHLPGMLRAYGDRELFDRFRTRFIFAPLFFVGVCELSAHTNLGGLKVVFLGWGIWHGMMQVYGFARIYDAKVGAFSPIISWLDWLMCLAWFGAGVTFSSGQTGQMLEAFYLSGGPIFAFDTVAIARMGWGVFVAVVTATFIANLVYVRMNGQKISTAKLLLFVSSFGFWWLSMVAIENVIIGVAVFEIFHDVQYLSIVWIFNRKRASSEGAGSFTRFLFRRSWLMLGVYVGLVFAYGFIHFASHNLIDREPIQKTLFGLITASALLHFYYDGFIWKVRERKTREGLGLAGGREEREVVPGWALHGMKWALFVVPIGALWWLSRDYRDSSLQAERNVAVFQALTAIAPDNADFRAKYGVSLSETGQRNEAESELRESIVLDPTSAEAHEALGRVLHAQLRHSEATASFKKAINVDAQFAQAHHGLGVSLHTQGDHTAAAKSLRRAIALDPDYAAAHYSLGVVLMELAKQSFDAGDVRAAREGLAEATRQFRRTIELNPLLSEAQRDLQRVAQIQLQLGSGAPLQ